MTAVAAAGGAATGMAVAGRSTPRRVASSGPPATSRSGRATTTWMCPASARMSRASGPSSRAGRWTTRVPRLPATPAAPPASSAAAAASRRSTSSYLRATPRSRSYSAMACRAAHAVAVPVPRIRPVSAGRSPRRRSSSASAATRSTRPAWSALPESTSPAVRRARRTRAARVTAVSGARPSAASRPAPRASASCASTRNRTLAYPSAASLRRRSSPRWWPGTATVTGRSGSPAWSSRIRPISHVVAVGPGRTRTTSSDGVEVTSAHPADHGANSTARIHRPCPAGGWAPRHRSPQKRLRQQRWGSRTRSWNPPSAP